MKLRFVNTIFFLLCFVKTSFTQEMEEETVFALIQPKHSYNIEFGLPVPIANKAFKTMLQGFFRTSLSYQFTLKNGLQVGAGANFTFFQLNRFEITPQMSGSYQLTNYYTKLGYEKFINERIGFDGGVKIGYASNLFQSDSLIQKVQKESTIVEPYFSFALTANHKSAYKWTIGYAFLGYGFTPNSIGDYINDDFAKSEFGRITRFLSFGFSYTHYFSRR